MKINLVLIFAVFCISTICAQEINTLQVKDWNTLRKSCFFESHSDWTINAPTNSGWYWGINIAHTSNSTVSSNYFYGGQIAFALASYTTPPSVYIRSTNVNGNGIWAKLVHSKGNHAIDGKLTVKEVEVKINTGADFVFSSDYKLKPLSEVESFVQENKHLPDIPSEKQMQENGLNLNDMQIKLLQKIEELTLYVIEQDKKYQELKEDKKSLEKRIKELESKSNNSEDTKDSLLPIDIE